MRVPWLNVRLKAVERALKDGALDVAYERATSPDLANDKRARRVLDQLVKPLLARARVHGQAGRYAEALADLDRLAAVNRGEPERSALRLRFAAEQRKLATERDAGEQAYDNAAEQINAGRLESGRVALERVENHHRRAKLENQLDARVQRSDQLLDQAAAALKGNDPASALRHWRDACERHGRTQEADTFADKLAPAVATVLRSAFETGRLEQFLSLWNQSTALRDTHATIYQGYERLVELTRDAVALVAEHDYARLRKAMLRMRGADVKARWIDEVLKAVDQVQDAEDLLTASPLGIMAPLSTRAASGPSAIRAGGHSLEATIAEAAHGARAGSAKPLLLLIDGSCSALVLRQNLVRLGRAGGSAPIDVPIPGDIQSHHADIINYGDDFFVMPRGPVRINHAPIRSALLRDGDRLRLGDKTKLEFLKPSAKSDTAVLKVSDRQRLPMDVSYVVLLRDTCLIGPQPSCHLRTREGESRIVLFVRDGELYARATGADGRPSGPAIALPLGVTQRIGDQSITITEYAAQQRAEQA